MKTTIVRIPVSDCEKLSKNAHWTTNGLFSHFRSDVTKLIPSSGSVDQPRKNRMLERFRKAENVTYDLYNNRLYNYASLASSVFNLTTSYYKIYYKPRYGKMRVEKFDITMYCAFELLYNITLLMAALEQNISKEFDNYRIVFISYCQLFNVDFDGNKLYTEFCNF